MANPSANTALEERLVQLLRRLGIRRAHFAACMPRDWEGLAAAHPDRISSLTLLAPMGINLAALAPAEFPVLVLAGDKGRPAKDTESAMNRLGRGELLFLKNYFSPSWADSAADRGDEIQRALRHVVARAEATQGASELPVLEEVDGEVDGISFRVRGKGVPLVLMPLALSPSQWDPLIPRLSEFFCTIALGGAALGMVAHLEARAQSGYMRVIQQLIEETELKPGMSILEAGCGPGALARRIARWTGGRNPIVAVDVNRYLLREAEALAKQEGMVDVIAFKAGDAEKLPFADNEFDVALACTVLEEGDADRMAAELARVTKRDGRVGIVVRSIDMSRWVNLTLRPRLKAKVEDRGLIGRSMQDGGCADASLYRRMSRAGLGNLKPLPQLASHNGGERLQYMQDRIAATLTPEERSEWRDAVTAARSEGTFFIAEPFHCAVGTKL